MIDSFGRKITYLRVSVTDRCNLRCSYCMAEAMVFRPRSDILSLEELDRICSAFVALGVRKLRVTGGEPLVRRGVTTLFRSLGRHLATNALDDLTVTTNGTRLAKHAATLADCGVRRVNVSLDTLDADTYGRLTRGGRIRDVMEGLDAASAAGLKVKINAVAQRRINDGEFDTLIAWCGDKGFDLTLIETMPMGGVAALPMTRNYLPLGTVRRRLAERWTLTDIPDDTGGPARYAHIAETGRRIGFITPMSHRFCDGCNRVRLASNGRLYTCLGQDDYVDLLAAVRNSESDANLVKVIEEAIVRKPKGHDFLSGRMPTRSFVDRHMNVTGG